jgi:[acyl-carrier-protein] S-malonyltransferase
MTAVIGMEDEAVAALVDQAAEGDVLTVANRNCPGQIVVSGEIPALDRFEALAKDAGARKISRLPITIASHSSLMASATAGLNEIIDTLTLQQPDVPVVANTTGQRLNTAEEIREELRFHVERGVDWTGSVRTMLDAGITTFVELGHGTVLAGLNRRIDRGATTLSLKDLGLPPA